MSQRRPWDISKTSNASMHKALDVRTPVPAYQLKQQREYLLNKKIRPAIDELSKFTKKVCNLENKVASPKIEKADKKSHQLEQDIKKIIEKADKKSHQLEQDIKKIIEIYKASPLEKKIPTGDIDEAKHIIQVTHFLVLIQKLNMMADELLANNPDRDKALPQGLRDMCVEYIGLERMLIQQTSEIQNAMTQYQKAKDDSKVERLASLEPVYKDFVARFNKVEKMYAPFLQPPTEEKKVEQAVQAAAEEDKSRVILRSHRKRDLLAPDAPDAPEASIANRPRVLLRSERNKNLLKPEPGNAAEQEPAHPSKKTFGR